MPIYEYQCEACGERLEVIQRISEDPLKDCPKCGKPALRKLISAAAFHLKGSGWYVTDFRDKKQKKPEAAKADSSADKESKPAAKDAPKESGGDSKPAESKPAAKSED